MFRNFKNICRWGRESAQNFNFKGNVCLPLMWRNRINNDRIIFCHGKWEKLKFNLCILGIRCFFSFAVHLSLQRQCHRIFFCFFWVIWARRKGHKKVLFDLWQHIFMTKTSKTVPMMNLFVSFLRFFFFFEVFFFFHFTFEQNELGQLKSTHGSWIYAVFESDAVI